MTDTVVLGFGQSGAPLLEQLRSAGTKVRLVTRSGRGPADVECVAADLTKLSEARRAIGEATTIYQTFAAPRYAAETWNEVLPPMNEHVLRIATATGATVVAVENLYAFASDGSPITAHTPLRPRSKKGAVQQRLLEARSASGARVRSIVAGDFYGASADTAHMGDRMFTPLLAGKTVRPLGKIDLPHAFTYLPDLARAMQHAAELDGDGHEIRLVPSAGNLTQRELITLTAEAAGLDTPKISPLSLGLTNTLGMFSKDLREIAEMGYQFAEPFVVDTREDERRLGMQPTPWKEAARETVQSRRAARRAQGSEQSVAKP